MEPMSEKEAEAVKELTRFRDGCASVSTATLTAVLGLVARIPMPVKKTPGQVLMDIHMEDLEVQGIMWADVEQSVRDRWERRAARFIAAMAK